MHLSLENPAALWGLLGVAWLAYLMWRNRSRHPLAFSWRRFLVVTLAFTLAVIGLSRPQLGRRVAQRGALKANLFLAVDISRSMNATDILPSRLGFSMAFGQKLAREVAGVKIAVFPFAYDGFLLMPLTADTTVITDMLSALSSGMTTNQGTDVSRVLEQLYGQIMRLEAMAHEQGEDWAPTQVLLLSDGETHEPLREDVVTKFRAKRIPIHTIGIGTVQGGTVAVDSRPMNTGRERFPQVFGSSPFNGSKIVTTKLDAKTLQRIAQLSNGTYFPAEFAEVSSVVRRITQMMQMGKLTTTFKVDREFFPFLLTLALMFFALDFIFGRWQYAIRAWLLAALLVGGAVSPAYAEDDAPAVDPETRAAQAYNEGLDALGRGDSNKAIELFQESAGLTKDKKVRKKALYNQGNAFMRLQDPIQAVQVYQQSLDTNSGDRSLEADANRRISDNITLAVKLEQQLRQQQQQQQQKQGKDGEGKPKNQPDDPKGPQKDYQAQQFSEEQKKRMFDLMASEEQQILQRVMEQRNKRANPETRQNDKPW